MNAESSIPGSLLASAPAGLFINVPPSEAARPASQPVRVAARTSEHVDTKIRHICLILSVMVIFNHSRTVDMTYGWDGINLSPISWAYFVTAPWEVLIQHFFSGALGRITNPFFFAASGFLFFFGWQPTVHGWMEKLRRRVTTLLLPFLIWGFLGMLITFSLALPAKLAELNAQETAGLAWLGALGEAFWTTSMPGQLWFIRALMLIMLCAPILAYWISRWRVNTLFVILAVYLSPFQTPWDWVDKSAICYFSFGATLGFLRADLEASVRQHAWKWIAFWLSTAGIYTVLSLTTSWDLTLLFKFMIIGGLFGIWGLYEWLPQGILTGLQFLSPYRFFIYMGFDPFLTIMQNEYQEHFGYSQGVNMIEYLLFPVVVVGVCIGVAAGLRRWSGRLYQILTGGR